METSSVPPAIKEYRTLASMTTLKAPLCTPLRCDCVGLALRLHTKMSGSPLTAVTWTVTVMFLKGAVTWLGLGLGSHRGHEYGHRHVLKGRGHLVRVRVRARVLEGRGHLRAVGGRCECRRGVKKVPKDVASLLYSRHGPSEPYHPPAWVRVCVRSTPATCVACTLKTVLACSSYAPCLGSDQYYYECVWPSP